MIRIQNHQHEKEIMIARSLYIHKLDRYTCVFPEGITIDCDQASAVGKSTNSYLEPDVGTQVGNWKIHVSKVRKLKNSKL